MVLVATRSPGALCSGHISCRSYGVSPCGGVWGILSGGYGIGVLEEGLSCWPWIVMVFVTAWSPDAVCSVCISCGACRASPCDGVWGILGGG